VVGAAKSAAKGRPQKKAATKGKIVRRTGHPLYVQVRDYIEGKIDSSRWGPGTMIPREKDLCRELEVSRITVREAMRMLVHDGKLERVAGRGTFVSSRKLEQRLNKFFSFTKWARQNGIRAESRLLRVETVDCGGPVAARLGIAPGDKVTRIERLRLGDGEPLSLEEIWISASLCPDLHLKDLARIPLNDILAQDYGVPPVRAIETIEPKTPDRHVKKLLHMNEEELCQFVEYTAFTQDSRIVFYNTELYRGDRIKFSIELTSG
jgi:GntR family transcriptional regulator